MNAWILLFALSAPAYLSHVELHMERGASGDFLRQARQDKIILLKVTITPLRPSCGSSRNIV